jgi:hypothetical protein
VHQPAEVADVPSKMRHFVRYYEVCRLKADNPALLSDNPIIVFASTGYGPQVQHSSVQYSKNLVSVTIRPEGNAEQRIKRSKVNSILICQSSSVFCSQPPKALCDNWSPFACRIHIISRGARRWYLTCKDSRSSRSCQQDCPHLSNPLCWHSAFSCVSGSGKYQRCPT